MQKAVEKTVDPGADVYATARAAIETTTNTADAVSAIIKQFAPRVLSVEAKFILVKGATAIVQELNRFGNGHIRKDALASQRSLDARSREFRVAGEMAEARRSRHFSLLEERRGRGGKPFGDFTHADVLENLSHYRGLAGESLRQTFYLREVAKITEAAPDKPVRDLLSDDDLARRYAAAAGYATQHIGVDDARA